MAVEAKIQDKMSRDVWLILPKGNQERCEEPDGCQGKNSTQDVKGWVVDSVKEKIQDKMQRNGWLSWKRFKTRGWLILSRGDPRKDVKE